jgi:hypothetical protein
MGSIVETVVSLSPPALTRLPICALAIPAIPAIGETIFVKPRLSSAVTTAALPAATAALADTMAAFPVSTFALAASTSALAARLACTALSRSCSVTPPAFAKGM